MVRKALSISGETIAEIREAGNGRDALGVLAGGGVDLVFTDINMPGMGGVELVERMWADEALAAIPVVVVSSERSAAMSERLRDKGVRAYVTKPFRPEEVRDVLRGIGSGGARG
jgi:two-component system chemotaxis response regulator CheY